jgi:hypothetical protein
VKRVGAALLAGWLLAVLISGPALAVGSYIDQYNACGGTNFGGAGITLAQTFQDAITGTLTGASLTAVGGTTMTVDVYGTNNGLGGGTAKPTGSPVASASASVPNAEDWVVFVFPSPPNVIAGNYYALVFKIAGSDQICGSGNTYTRGSAMVASGAWFSMSAVYPKTGISDWAFRTFVAKPVPTPSPTIKPTPKPTPKPSPTATATATASPTAVQATQTLPSETASAVDIAVASATALASDPGAAPVTAAPTETPGASTVSDTGSGQSGGSLLVVLLLALVALAVVGGGIWFFVLRPKRRQAP